jgi:hypothetical protein
MPRQAVIGLIGGMSWESSAEYYRIINREVRNRLGGAHSARSLMWSVDFGEVERLQHQGEWDELTRQMVDAGCRLERGGADFVVLCTNTMHRMADELATAIRIPLLHIADPTAEKIKAAGFSKVGLLGTAFTMEQDFYKGRLQRRFGLEVLTPDADDRRVFTTSSTRSSSRARFARNRGWPIARSCRGWLRGAHRPLFWAARRSCCWCPRRTAPSPCSTPPPSMPLPRSTAL